MTDLRLRARRSNGREPVVRERPFSPITAHPSQQRSSWAQRRTCCWLFLGITKKQVLRLRPRMTVAMLARTAAYAPAGRREIGRGSDAIGPCRPGRARCDRRSPKDECATGPSGHAAETL